MTRRSQSTLIVGTLAALLVAGVVSYFASPHPDGLEKTLGDLGVAASPGAGVAPPPSPFDEYRFRWLPAGLASNAIAGVTGVLVVLALLLGVGALLRRSRRPAASAAGDRAAGS